MTVLLGKITVSAFASATILTAVAVWTSESAAKATPATDMDAGFFLSGFIISLLCISGAGRFRGKCNHKNYCGQLCHFFLFLRLQVKIVFCIVAPALETSSQVMKIIQQIRHLYRAYRPSITAHIVQCDFVPKSRKQT
jgi:hypothetical protein